VSAYNKNVKMTTHRAVNAKIGEFLRLYEIFSYVSVR